jgi:ribosomal protein S18 acetylase RimI-like enzyme
VRQDVRVRRLVRPAAPTDRERILDVTTSAFVTEPAFAHFFADSYDAHARTFLGFLVDLRLAGGLVWVEEVDGAVVAVSMWDPPGGPQLDAGSQEEMWRAAADRFGPEVEARLDAYDAAVHDLAPPGDHFYLGVIASDPEARGRGHGSAVLLPGLGAADAAGLPTSLETGTEGNVGFYTRFGFDVSHELDLGDGTRIWCLTRPPAASSG